VGNEYERYDPIKSGTTIWHELKITTRYYGEDDIYCGVC